MFTSRQFIVSVLCHLGVDDHRAKRPRNVAATGDHSRWPIIRRLHQFALTSTQSRRRELKSGRIATTVQFQRQRQSRSEGAPRSTSLRFRQRTPHNKMHLTVGAAVLLQAVLTLAQGQEELLSDLPRTEQPKPIGCMDMTRSPGTYTFTSEGSTAVCALFIAGMPDELPVFEFEHFDIDCQKGGRMEVRTGS
ncbi:hypothetical protein LSAT2_001041 [Lamellibrachia satsuma]|nr:hypothetical protein LSAT2_001041 [Lamellibrachia satsuma]